jgi:hypothetical protein
MITTLQAAQVLQMCAVGILGITVLLKILPMLRLDCFRQKMFSVRDELFDYAAAGNISFDDPAYVLLRRQMNGMIRFGHRLTLFRGLVTWMMSKIASYPESTWNDSWIKALANIKNDQVRAQMEAFHGRSMNAAAKHLISGSLVLWVALGIAATIIALTGAALGARQLLKAAAKKILSGPIDQRFIEEDVVGSMA